MLRTNLACPGPSALGLLSIYLTYFMSQCLVHLCVFFFCFVSFSPLGQTSLTPGPRPSACWSVCLAYFVSQYFIHLRALFCFDILCFCSPPSVLHPWNHIQMCGVEWGGARRRQADTEPSGIVGGRGKSLGLIPTTSIGIYTFICILSLCRPLGGSFPQYFYWVI